jgi:hypothetical protein
MPFSGVGDICWSSEHSSMSSDYSCACLTVSLSLKHCVVALDGQAKLPWLVCKENNQPTDNQESALQYTFLIFTVSFSSIKPGIAITQSKHLIENNLTTYELLLGGCSARSPAWS